MTKAMEGEGQRLDGRNHLVGASRANELYKDDGNSHFGRSTRPRGAREARAEAAEARIQAEKVRSRREARLTADAERDELFNERDAFGGRGNPNGDDSETEDELDARQEAKRRRARTKGAVNVSGSEEEEDQLESDTDSEMEDPFFGYSATQKGKRKQASKSPSRSTPKGTQVGGSSKNETAKQRKERSEKSRKAENRRVGDTWKELSLDSEEERFVGNFNDELEKELSEDEDDGIPHDSEDGIFEGPGSGSNQRNLSLGKKNNRTPSSSSNRVASGSSKKSTPRSQVTKKAP